MSEQAETITRGTCGEEGLGEEGRLFVEQFDGNEGIKMAGHHCVCEKGRRLNAQGGPGRSEEHGSRCFSDYRLRLWCYSIGSSKQRDFVNRR